MGNGHPGSGLGLPGGLDGDGGTGDGVFPGGDKGAEFRQSLLQHKKVLEEYDYLSKITNFDERTLRLLHARFMTIDKSVKADGSISVSELAGSLGLSAESLLVKRFFSLMDDMNLGQLNFRNFAIFMSKLSVSAPDNKDKLDISFRLFDVNNDGAIDRDELRALVVSSLDAVGMELTPKQVDQVIDNTFEACDTNENGKIEFKEYCDYCERNPRVLQPFTLDISSLTRYELDARKHTRISTITNESDLTAAAVLAGGTPGVTATAAGSSSMSLRTHGVSSTIGGAGMVSPAICKPRTLHHGVLDTSSTDGRLSKFKKKMGKSVPVVGREQVIKVSAIHSAHDLFDDDEKRGVVDDEFSSGFSSGFMADTETGRGKSKSKSSKSRGKSADSGGPRTLLRKGSARSILGRKSGDIV